MINLQELLFVVDENNNPIKPQPRAVVHKKEIWHRSTDVWVINSKREVLCQKRSFRKDINPGFWESFFGGHILAGEGEVVNAVNEMYEELGIKIKPEDLHFFKIVKDSSGNTSKGFAHRQFKYVFWLKTDDELDSFNLEEDEMDEIKWVPLIELTKILLKDKNKTWVLPIYAKDILSVITRQQK